MKHGLLLGIVLLAACQTQRNYSGLEGPRYHGEPPPHIAAAAPADTIQVVAFNIMFAMQVESALHVLRTDPAIRGAGIILLQEMDGPGVRYIARSLGMWYVYYPSSQHFRHGRDFGNAVLSRWPIVADRKLVLPHKARVYRTLRTATGASILIGRDTVRAYSIHLGTLANVNAQQRREQLQMVLDDAAGYEHVIIGGDMNEAGVGRLALENGYDWPTEQGPPTATIGRLDHIFMRGLSIPQTGGSGTVMDIGDASDHLPVWAKGILRQE